MKSKKVVTTTKKTPLSVLKKFHALLLKSVGKSVGDKFNFDKFMRKVAGFKSKRSCGIGHPYIYINKKLGVVIKCPSISDDEDYGSNKFKVKTLTVDFKDEWQHWEQILIQPLVDVSYKARTKAHRFLTKYESNHREEFGDMHTNNVGMYAGKPVRIDW